jgi:hypothetical protein
MRTSWPLVGGTVLVAVGCASPSGDVPSGNASERATLASPIREISCSSEARQRHAEFRFRLSADGKVREGTVMRGYSQGAPDARVEVTRVSEEGGRLSVEANEGSNHYRFTLARAGFAATTQTALDARMEETNDQTVLEAYAPGFDCSLSEMLDGFAVFDPDAHRLFDALRVNPLKNPMGEDVKVIGGINGPFRLYCNGAKDGLCSLQIPAIVTKVEGGLVTYAYDLDPKDSQALAAALTGGSFHATSIHDAWTRAAAAGADMDLRCEGSKCTASSTIPDTFYEHVP